MKRLAPILIAILGLLQFAFGISAATAQPLGAPGQGWMTVQVIERTVPMDSGTGPVWGIRRLELKPEVILDSSMIQAVRLVLGPQSRPVIELGLNRQGVSQLTEASAANLGGSMAVVVDGKVLTIWEIRTRHSGRNVVIDTSTAADITGGGVEAPGIERIAVPPELKRERIMKLLERSAGKKAPV